MMPTTLRMNVLEVTGLAYALQAFPRFLFLCRLLRLLTNIPFTTTHYWLCRVFWFSLYLIVIATNGSLGSPPDAPLRLISWGGVYGVQRPSMEVLWHTVSWQHLPSAAPCANPLTSWRAASPIPRADRFRIHWYRSARYL